MAHRQTADDGTAPVEPGDFSASRAVAPATPSEGLHVCPRCACDLVFPVDWAPAGPGTWSVHLRCPDCEWHDHGVHTQAVVDRFDEELDRGTELLLADLTALTRSNMKEQIDRFVVALRAGWVLPEDF